jgi:hypothetical protein
LRGRVKMTCVTVFGVGTAEASRGEEAMSEPGRVSQYRPAIRVGTAARWIAAVLCSLGALGSVPTQAQNPTLPGVYTNDEQTGDGIARAIDAAIDRMNFITRPVARSRLRKTNAPHRRVTIATSEQEITVAFDSNQPVRMPADGRTAKWTREDGEVFDVSAQWSGDKLVQTFEAEDGQRTNTFVLGPDGRALSVQVEVTSPQLPAPVRYELAFERQAGP